MRLLAVASACAVALAQPAAVLAAPADLDRSFGDDGIAQVEGPGGSIFASEASAQLAIGPRDEAFVLYSNYAPCSPFSCAVDLSVARFDADGKRDVSYGVGAGSQLEVRQFTERHAFAIAVGPDGKPVVVASNSPDQAPPGVEVARFDSSGHLDGGFGVGGVAAQPTDALPNTALAVAVQPDGKIVVAGEGAEVESGRELIVDRYLPNGEIDPGFGVGGTVEVTLPTRTGSADLLLDPAGKMTVAGPSCCIGYSGPSPSGGFSLVRLLGDGGLDSGFGGSGEAVFPMRSPGAAGSVEGVASSPDGGTVVLFEERAETTATTDNLAKILPDGSLDQTFGSNGRTRLYPRVGTLDPRRIVSDAAGRLVGVGWEGGHVAAYRLKADGGLDRTFDGGRSVVLPSGETPLAVALQSTGRILVLAGEGCCSGRSFSLVGLRGGRDRTRCLGHRATIVGTSRKDELTGTPHRDVIAALGGNDEVRALGGPDLICGGKGHDELFGGAGRDEVRP